MNSYATHHFTPGDFPSASLSPQGLASLHLEGPSGVAVCSMDIPDSDTNNLDLFAAYLEELASAATTLVNKINAYQAMAA